MSWMDEMWETHTRVAKDITPGSDADIRFLTLGLAGEVGEFANLVKKQWRAQFSGGVPVSPEKLAEEFADCRAYLYLLGKALGLDEDKVMEEYVLPKIRARWPKK